MKDFKETAKEIFNKVRTLHSIANKEELIKYIELDLKIAYQQGGIDILKKEELKNDKKI